jgi:hypothetical protein
MPHVDTNLPTELLRWSIKRAAKEFGLSEETIIKRLGLVKELPDPVSKSYSTRQLLNGIYGDINSARLSELRERTRNWELRNSILTGQSLRREEIEKTLGQLFISFKSAIEATGMSRAEKFDVLEVLGSWPIVIRETARQQTRKLSLRSEEKDGGGNGED